MNGEPKALPSNHVEWANGFKSNMPDWPTARRCAHSQKMLTALKGARTLMLAMDLRADQEWQHSIDQKRFESILDDICFAIDVAEGMDVVKKSFDIVPLSGFPKPPGIK